MKDFEVLETIQIEAPADVVRAQFGDVEHHAKSEVHRGVAFQVISDDGVVCRYLQTSRVGPLRLKQELQLARTSEGVLDNRILSGQFAGGAIAFVVTPVSKTSSCVEARLTAPLRRHEQLAAPVLRRVVRRSLKHALAEDRHDIESGVYAASGSTGSAGA